QAPLIFFTLIQTDFIVVVRKNFSESGNSDGPFARLTQSIFQFSANIEFSNIPRPTASASTSLIAKAPKVVALIIAHILKARNINAVRTCAIVIAVVETFNTSTSPKSEMVIHYVVSQFTAAAA